MPNQPTIEQRELEEARTRVLKTIEKGPHSVAELAKSLGKSPKLANNNKQRENLAKAVVDDLLSAGRIYTHPVGGRNRSLRFGLEPADPDKYVSKSGLKNFQSIYEILLKANVPGEEILASAGAKLKPPVDLGRANGQTSINGSPEQTNGRNSAIWLNEIVNYLTDYNRKHPTFSCPFPELYRAVAEPHGIDISEFHDGLRELGQQRLIHLVTWTQPLYKIEEERFAMLAGKEIRYYARLPE